MPISISLAALAKKFITMPAKFEACTARRLKIVGSKVREDAMKKFGTYQPAVGPYPAWEPLALSTVYEKGKAGATSDDPLIGHYPTGKKNTVWGSPLRMAVETYLEKTGAFIDMAIQIGTKDPLGKYHEYGTPDAQNHMPPRPWLRPAAFENEAFFVQQMNKATIETIAMM